MAALLPFSIDDVRYPSDNNYGIPVLNATMQAYGILGNLRIWGKGSRSTPYPKDTYAFYCKDYKFTALIKHPDTIAKTQCAAIVEPNFSTTSRMPRIIGLYGIYQKRKIARFAQTCGIKVLVDLTVDPKFAQDNLLGVPAGWQSYCIRATKYYGQSLILDNWELAKQHSGIDHPAFIVYGGGKAIQQLCLEQHWDWEPEHMNRDRTSTWEKAQMEEPEAVQPPQATK